MLKKAARIALTALIWLCLWEIAALITGSELLLPGPAATAKSLFSLLVSGQFWASVAATLARISAGYILGMLAGAVLGALTAGVLWLDRALAPLLGVIKATPLSSFIILVLLWLTTGMVPVFIAFLIVAPIAWANVREGARATDPTLLEMAKAYGFGRKKTIKYIYAPSIRPQFAAAATTALGLAWKAGVTAEVLASPALSIGRGLYESKLYLETPELFAWTSVIIALSMLLERGVKKLIALSIRNRPRAGGSGAARP